MEFSNADDRKIALASPNGLECPGIRVEAIQADRIMLFMERLSATPMPSSTGQVKTRTTQVLTIQNCVFSIKYLPAHSRRPGC